MLSRILWPNNESLRITERVRSVVACLLLCFMNRAVANLRRVIALLGMTAQCLAMPDTEFERNNAKVDLTECFIEIGEGKRPKLNMFA